MSRDEDLAPPPYSPTPCSQVSPITTSGPYHPSSTSLFQSQLSSLRGQILEEQAVRGSIRDQEDSEILSMLVPHVEELLDSIAAIHPPPTLIEATLVPDGTIRSGWRFSDAEETHPGKIKRMIRVTRRVKADNDKKTQHVQSHSATTDTRDRGFDEWGRWTEDEGSKSTSEADMWWSDEDMARRLARHLQPVRATPSVERVAVREHVERAKETKRAGRWSMFKKDDASQGSSPPPPPPLRQQPVDDVEMNVSAEEVTFRRQSEMGLWESKTGWGVIVRVRIRNT